MNCLCEDDENRTQRRISDEIDKQLKQDKIDFYKEHKILLLGAAESGKSTIIKQMRIVHGSGYTEEDRIGFIPYIHRNIFTAIMTLIEAMKTLGPKLGVEYEDEQTCGEFIEELEQIDCYKEDPLSYDIFEAIKYIWQDVGIQNVYRQRNKFHLMDSAKYYLDRIDHIKHSSYIPSLVDVLRVRVPTSGIIEYSFRFDGIQIKMVDVGGQKTERRKWIHSFENVTSIMFLAAMSEYDEMDSIHNNRLCGTRNLFKTVISLKCLEMASVILFLNKADIFKEKLLYSNLSKYFPEYDGPKNNDFKGREFILKMFLSDNPDPDKKDIYPHYTCATDTGNIKIVFKAIKNTILTNSMDNMLEF